MKITMMRSGQSLIEYGFIGTLIVVVSIAGLSVVGGNLGEILQGLKSDMKHHSTAAATAVPAAGTAAAAGQQSAVPDSSTLNDSGTIPSAAASSAAVLGSTASENVCLQGGLCVSIPVIADGPVTQTTGSMGGGLVASMADSLSELAEQLESQGTDPTLVNLVTKLASEGHNVGNAISALETCGYDCAGSGILQAADPSGPSCSDGTSECSYSYKPDTSSFAATWNTLQDYLQSHPNAGVAAIVNLEAGNILSVGEGAQLTTFQDKAAPASAPTDTYTYTTTDTTATTPTFAYVDTYTYDYTYVDTPTTTYDSEGNAITTLVSTLTPTLTLVPTLTLITTPPLTPTPTLTLITTPPTTSTTKPSESKMSNSAVLVHQSANTICENGGNQNVCIQPISSTAP